MIEPVIVKETLLLARAAQPGWAATGLAGRLRVVRRLRRLLGTRATWLAAEVTHRPAGDTLVAELLPLAEGLRFLCDAAPGLLAERRPPGRRPAWLAGVSSRVRRAPLGVVLVIGPGNYPLFLPGVQALQALVAGNAVVVKPAPGCTAPMRALAALLREAGLPDGLLLLLPEDAGAEAVSAGFDHIVLTGSAETGRRVLEAAAATLTPCTMELSGCDPAFVLPGADLGLVARSLAYGLRLNGGATCIAPRRVFVSRRDAAALEAALLPLLPAIAPARLPAPVLARAVALMDEAGQAGARLVGRPADPCPPLLVLDAAPDMALLRADLFAPWLAVVPVEDAAAMLRADAACPYALGASVWGPAGPAMALARELRALSVCVNDLIVPTADPRLPFGGRGRSGFGATRGAEGLLAMTVPQAISRRVLPFRPHLAPARPGDAASFAAMATLLHAGWRERMGALLTLARAGR